MAKDNSWISKDLNHLLKPLNLSHKISNIAENVGKSDIIKKIA
ncbi:11265_t:CDS:1, partial [Rhizophagus irregularis]